MARFGFIDLLFGCCHSRLSFPRSARRGERPRPAARQTGVYVVCLNCGKEMPYDWEQMRVVSSEDDSARARRTAEAHG